MRAPSLMLFGCALLTCLAFGCASSCPLKEVPAKDVAVIGINDAQLMLRIENEMVTTSTSPALKRAILAALPLNPPADAPAPVVWPKLGRVFLLPGEPKRYLIQYGPDWLDGNVSANQR